MRKAKFCTYKDKRLVLKIISAMINIFINGSNDSGYEK